MHGAGGGAPKGAKNGNYRHGAATREIADTLSDVRRIVSDAHESVAIVKQQTAKLGKLPYNRDAADSN